jgi:putative iron-only hydrogenase system regulator
MGLPYASKGLHIIALIVHASNDEIGALTGKLGALTGVEVKSALTKV